MPVGSTRPTADVTVATSVSLCPSAMMGLSGLVVTVVPAAATVKQRPVSSAAEA